MKEAEMKNCQTLQKLLRRNESETRSLKERLEVLNSRRKLIKETLNTEVKNALV